MKCNNSNNKGRLHDSTVHEPEIHRVDPEFGSTLKALIGIYSQTAGSTCEFWVNRMNFTFGEGAVEKAHEALRKLGRLGRSRGR